MSRRKKLLSIILILVSLNVMGSLIVFLIPKIPKNIRSIFQNLTTFQEYSILIGVLLGFVVGGNFVIHKYYQNRHNKVLNQIEHKNFKIFKNVKLTQCWSVGFRINRADVALLDSQMVVFVFNGFSWMKQEQPIVLFYANEPNDSIAGISKMCSIGNINIIRSGFEIDTQFDALFGTQNLCFKFSLKPHEKTQIVDWLIANKLVQQYYV